MTLLALYRTVTLSTAMGRSCSMAAPLPVKSPHAKHIRRSLTLGRPLWCPRFAIRMYGSPETTDHHRGVASYDGNG